jgi:hypothetical protein
MPFAPVGDEDAPAQVTMISAISRRPTRFPQT